MDEYQEILERGQQNLSSIIEKYICLSHGLPSPSVNSKQSNPTGKPQNLIRESGKRHATNASALLPSNVFRTYCDTNTSLPITEDESIFEEVNETLIARKVELGLPENYLLKELDIEELEEEENPGSSEALSKSNDISNKIKEKESKKTKSNRQKRARSLSVNGDTSKSKVEGKVKMIKIDHSSKNVKAPMNVTATKKNVTAANKNVTATKKNGTTTNKNVTAINKNVTETKNNVTSTKNNVTATKNVNTPRCRPNKNTKEQNTRTKDHESKNKVSDTGRSKNADTSEYIQALSGVEGSKTHGYVALTDSLGTVWMPPLVQEGEYGKVNKVILPEKLIFLIPLTLESKLHMKSAGPNCMQDTEKEAVNSSFLGMPSDMQSAALSGAGTMKRKYSKVSGGSVKLNEEDPQIENTDEKSEHQATQSQSAVSQNSKHRQSKTHSKASNGTISCIDNEVEPQHSAERSAYDRLSVVQPSESLNSCSLPKSKEILTSEETHSPVQCDLKKVELERQCKAMSKVAKNNQSESQEDGEIIESNANERKSSKNVMDADNHLYNEKRKGQSSHLIHHHSLLPLRENNYEKENDIAQKKTNEEKSDVEQKKKDKDKGKSDIEQKKENEERSDIAQKNKNEEKSSSEWKNKNKEKSVIEQKLKNKEKSIIERKLRNKEKSEDAQITPSLTLDINGTIKSVTKAQRWKPSNKKLHTETAVLGPAKVYEINSSSDLSLDNSYLMMLKKKVKKRHVSDNVKKKVKINKRKSLETGVLHFETVRPTTDSDRESDLGIISKHSPVRCNVSPHLKKKCYDKNGNMVGYHSAIVEKSFKEAKKYHNDEPSVEFRATNEETSSERRLHKSPENQEHVDFDRILKKKTKVVVNRKKSLETGILHFKTITVNCDSENNGGKSPSLLSEDHKLPLPLGNKNKENVESTACGNTTMQQGDFVENARNQQGLECIDKKLLQRSIVGPTDDYNGERSSSTKPDHPDIKKSKECKSKRKNDDTEITDMERKAKKKKKDKVVKKKDIKEVAVSKRNKESEGKKSSKIHTLVYESVRISPDRESERSDSLCDGGVESSYPSPAYCELPNRQKIRKFFVSKQSVSSSGDTNTFKAFKTRKYNLAGEKVRNLSKDLMWQSRQEDSIVAGIDVVKRKRVSLAPKTQSKKKMEGSRLGIFSIMISEDNTLQNGSRMERRKAALASSTLKYQENKHLPVSHKDVRDTLGNQPVENRLRHTSELKETSTTHRQACHYSDSYDSDECQNYLSVTPAEKSSSLSKGCYLSSLSQVMKLRQKINQSQMKHSVERSTLVQPSSASYWDSNTAGTAKTQSMGHSFWDISDGENSPARNSQLQATNRLNSKNSGTKKRLLSPVKTSFFKKSFLLLSHQSFKHRGKIVDRAKYI